MRIFLGAFGQPGHAFPMLALGKELAARGHQVMYETWSRWQEDVTACGMEFSPAPEFPVFPTLELPLKPYEAVVRAVAATRPAVASFQPDVVVHDILTMAPALSAELEGVPVATLIPHVYPVPGPGIPPFAMGARLPRTALGRGLWRRMDQLVLRGLRHGQAELNEARGRLGLAPVRRIYGGLSERLCMVATVPALEYPREWPRGVEVVGPLMWEPPFRGVQAPPGDDPLVLVAPSTAQDPSHRLLRAAVEGLGGVPGVRVLAATNRRALSRGVRVRPNVRVVDWMQYSREMERSALVLSNAGHGTLVRALASGRPVLAAPHAGDMAENAARADWAGLGIRVPFRLVTPRTIRLAVQRALADPDLAARAREVAGWVAANPGAVRAANLVEGLGAGGAD